MEKIAALARILHLPRTQIQLGGYPLHLLPYGPKPAVHQQRQLRFILSHQHQVYRRVGLQLLG